MKFVLEKPETSLYSVVQTDILNSLGATQECDRQTNGQTEPPLAIA